jgi:hypothetical protein
VANGLNTNRSEELLAEILKWTKFMGADKVRAVLNSTLDTPQKLLVYHLSDSNRGSVEIANLARTSDRTVRRYWESWARVGIVDVIRVRGGDRYKKSFNVEDFGMIPPEAGEPGPPPAPPSEGTLA